MRSVLAIFVVSLLILTGGAVYGQDVPVVPVARSVGFLDGNTVGTPSLTDTGPAGLSRLGDLFTRLGASVRRVPADEPIPPDIEVLAVIGPTRPFPITTTSYLWDFLARGGHLLLALDPNGHNGVSSDRGDSGLNQLLNREYGLRFADDFLIESWFANDSLSDVSSSWSEAVPEDFAAHPIVEPLIAADLPVRYWGGRSMFIEALTGNAVTSPLIYTESSYGETGRLDLRQGDTAQYTLNIGPDTQGRLLLGAVAQRPSNGSRVAVLGDSEIFRNRFGMAAIPTEPGLARYAGDGLLVERLVHWLLGLPIETWPALSPDFTPIVIDGDDSDWPAEVTVWGMDAASPGALRVAFDDQFLYVSVVPPEYSTDADLVALLTFSDEGVPPLQIENDLVTDPANPGVPIPDSAAAAGTVLEIRVPLRAAYTSLDQVCVGTALSRDQLICTAIPVEAARLETRAPVIQPGNPGPSAVPREDVNLRTGPGLQFEIIELLRDRPPLRVLGRNADGTWIRVESGRTSGWAYRPLLNLNVGLDLLPIVE